HPVPGAPAAHTPDRDGGRTDDRSRTGSSPAAWFRPVRGQRASRARERAALRELPPEVALVPRGLAPAGVSAQARVEPEQARVALEQVWGGGGCLRGRRRSTEREPPALSPAKAGPRATIPPDGALYASGFNLKRRPACAKRVSRRRAGFPLSRALGAPARE